MPKTGRVPELDDLAKEIERIENKEKPFKDNLSKKERKSLNDLRTNDSITVKEADKGGAVVIMTKNHHYEMVMEHLLGNRSRKPRQRSDGNNKRVYR